MIELALVGVVAVLSWRLRPRPAEDVDRESWMMRQFVARGRLSRLGTRETRVVARAPVEAPGP
jgi:hypothetical protein